MPTFVHLTEFKFKHLSFTASRFGVFSAPSPGTKRVGKQDENTD
jgi:hypothetical protein